MTPTLNPGQLETVYEALAETLDTLPEDRHALYLAKLALLLAHEIGNPETVRSHITVARANLDT